MMTEESSEELKQVKEVWNVLDTIWTGTVRAGCARKGTVVYKTML